MIKMICVFLAISLQAFAAPPEYEQQEFIAAIPRIPAKLGEQVYADTFTCRMAGCSVQSESGMTCDILYDAESKYVVRRRLRVVCSTPIGAGYREKVFTLSRSREFLVAAAERNEVGLNERRPPRPARTYRRPNCEIMDMAMGRCYRKGRR